MADPAADAELHAEPEAPPNGQRFVPRHQRTALHRRGQAYPLEGMAPAQQRTLADYQYLASSVASARKCAHLSCCCMGSLEIMTLRRRRGIACMTPI